MFGFFGMFGRAEELRTLDKALAAAGVPARAVPDGAKLAAIRQLQQETGRRKPGADISAEAAEMLAYCLLGPQGLTDALGAERTRAVEARIEAALAAEDSLDARLLLLALHAGLVQPDVIAHYELSADAG